MKVNGTLNSTEKPCD